ncbi:hypothetical protein [Candidatus Hodarchaeum mangrovi]
MYQLLKTTKKDEILLCIIGFFIMILYLGIVPGFFPHIEEALILKKMKEINAGLMFSYWTFRKFIPKIISKGIHDFFSYEGPIMIDSGAYSAFNMGISISCEDYANFLKKIDLKLKDKIVNLDLIGDYQKSFSNWKYLSKMIDTSIIPVIHFPEINSNYPNCKIIGLGGMVPSLKINQPGSIYNVGKWVVLISSKNPGKEYHGFGIGSPFNQIIFWNYLSSLDWIGWRRNAAVCECYTPEGSKTVTEARKKPTKRSSLSQSLFDQYKPPFIESFNLLSLPGTKGWKYRALWNVWWFLNCQNWQVVIDQSKYVRSMKERMRKIISNTNNKFLRNTQNYS